MAKPRLLRAMLAAAVLLTVAWTIIMFRRTLRLPRTTVNDTLLPFPEQIEPCPPNRTLPRVYGIYHAFVPSDGDIGARQILDAQLALLRSSGLLAQAIRVNVNLIAPAGSEVPELRVARRRFGEKVAVRQLPDGSESLSIDQVRQVCAHDPLAFVFYVHSKGTFHRTPENELMRTHLMAAVVGQWRRCVDRMREVGADTCGWRLSTFPFVHYPGNMWWARCSHVNRLRPLSDITGPRSWDSPECAGNFVALGRERMAAEHWVGSHPDMRPLDCLPNSTYLYGYKGMELAQPSKCDLGPRLSVHALTNTRYEPHIYACHASQKGNCQHILKEYEHYYGRTAPGDFDAGTVGYFVKLCADAN